MRIEEIAPVFQHNFLSGQLPLHSESFYNSKQFARNELQVLSTMISMDDKAQEEGLQQIKKAIDGLT